jgi:hypothetical protein
MEKGSNDKISRGLGPVTSMPTRKRGKNGLPRRLDQSLSARRIGPETDRNRKPKLGE